MGRPRVSEEPDLYPCRLQIVDRVGGDPLFRETVSRLDRKPCQPKPKVSEPWEVLSVLKSSKILLYYSGVGGTTERFYRIESTSP